MASTRGLGDLAGRVISVSDWSWLLTGLFLAGLVSTARYDFAAAGLGVGVILLLALPRLRVLLTSAFGLILLALALARFAAWPVSSSSQWGLLFGALATFWGSVALETGIGRGCGVRSSRRGCRDGSGRSS